MKGKYSFEEVRAALSQHYGYRLRRADNTDDKDGRWDVTHSRTGFIVSGSRPGFRYGHWRYRSLADVVRGCDLADIIHRRRANLPSKASGAINARSRGACK